MVFLLFFTIAKTLISCLAHCHFVLLFLNEFCVYSYYAIKLQVSIYIML